MKKALFAAVMPLVAIAMSAQTDVVKDLTNQMKAKNPDYKVIIEQIRPALTNPETANNVEAWMIAAKASMGQYDNLYKKKLIGQDVDIPLMGNSLMDAMEFYIGALPLDSVADAKGKIKTKYSKDIIKQVKDNYNALNATGVDLYNNQDFNGAYRAWEMFLNLPTNPVLGANAPSALPDSIMSEIAFNKGITAWQADSLDRALKSFKQAISLGYNKKQVYDYAISIAAQKGDNKDVVELATLAYPVYGSEDPKFLQLMINGKIENKEYDEARKMLDEAIAATPDNAQLYFVLGILEETLENNEAALVNYKKSANMDPDFAQAQYYVGRAICNEAYALDDKAGQGTTQQEYLKIRNEQVNPMFKEAAGYLERAYKLDPDNMHDALVYLRNVYYNLNDEENLKRVEAL